MRIFLSKQKGAAALVTGLMLLAVAAMTITGSVEIATLKHKSASNVNQRNEAIEAAEAGLNFGIVYFNEMKDTIIASASNGYINYGDSNTNKTLSNGSYYEITYSNPTQYNYDLIEVRAKAVGSNSGSTTVITQKIKSVGGGGNMLKNLTDGAVASKGKIKLENSSSIVNEVGEKSAELSTSIEIKDSSITKSTTDTSNSSNINSDITQNDTDLSASPNSLFQTLFNDTQANIKSSADYIFTSNLNSNLNGKENAVIWVDSEKVELKNQTTIGSVDKPVILILNTEEVKFENDLKIYGLLVIIGEAEKISIKDDTLIEGGVAFLPSEPEKIEIKNNSKIILKDGMAEKFSQLIPGAASGGSGGYVPVPGTWSNF